MFHPKGGIIRREMENYSRRRHEEAGYEFVNTPHITKGGLFHISGHLRGTTPAAPACIRAELNEDGTVRSGEDYYLKTMNCPMHNLIYRSRGRSYRELPLRLFEFGTVYRYEKSGVVHGLTRVRGMTRTTRTSTARAEPDAGRARSLLAFVLDLLRDYGLDDFYLELSTRDDDRSSSAPTRSGQEATEALRQAAEDSGLDLVPDPGGAAYYGAEDLRAGQGRASAEPGRCRPSRWTSSSRIGSSWSTPRPTAPGSGR